MAETVLRFGPEWLRALTDGGVSHQNASANPVSNHQNIPSSTTNLTSNSSLPTVFPINKYKLAQYRYGREEMLALFDNNIDMAQELRELPTLTVEKCQLPLALIPMNEDEHRLWSRSVNSEAMLRVNKMNTPGGSNAERDRPERNVPVSGTTTNERTTVPPIRTMRGGMTAERSRGRGRPAYYQRTGPYDENGETGEPRDAFRKNYEKSSSICEDGPREKSFDRSLSRGESSDEGNRNRKDVRLADNWRSGGRSDDRSNWRARVRTDDNWNRNHDSWRTDDRDGIGEDNHRNGPIMRRGYGNHYKRNSEGWDDMDDEERKSNLPEWSLDDDMSCEARVGTFDASGAFREGSMDDDIRDKPPGHNSKDHSDLKKSAVDHNNSVSSDSVNMDKAEASPDDSKLQAHVNDDELLSSQPYEESKIMTAPPIPSLSDNSIDSQFQLQSQVSHQQHQPSLLPQIQSQIQNQQMSSQIHPSLQPSLQAQLQPQFQSHLQPQMQPPLQSQLQQQIQSQLQPQLQPQMQSQLQSQMLHQHPPQTLSQPQPQSQMNTHHHIKALLENSRVNPNHKPHPEEDGLLHLEKAAENMVAQWTAEADQEERVLRDKQSNKMTVIPLHHEDAYKWFYRDPQGEIQGPFLPQEMCDWLMSGYFTVDLLVRRGCDERFSQLGELVKAWGRVPFITEKNPPPVVNMTPQPQPNKSMNADNLPSALSPNSLYSQNFRQQQILQHRQQDHLQRQFFLNQQLQMQTQLRQLLDQLKKQDGFSTLSAQEQQCVLVQQYVTAQHQTEQRRVQPTPPQPTNIPDEPKSVMEQLSRLGVPVVRSGPLLTQSTQSIWDMGNGGVITASALEELQRRERDKIELEEKKKLIEKEQIEAHKRATIEAQRKREEEQRIEELTRKLEQEKKLREELLRDQEERRRREEEDEKRRMEQERLELEREKKRLEEERRKHEEMLRAEEAFRKRREAERQRIMKEAEEAERLRQEQMQQELQDKARKPNQLSQQKQNQLQKQLLQAQQNQQVKERKENQKQVQNQQTQIQKESKKIWPDRTNPDKADGWSFDSDSPSPDANASSIKFPTQQQIWKSSEDSADKNASKQIWGQTCQTKNSTISLAEIQRLQEAKEKEEKVKQAQQTERQNIYSEKQSTAQQLFEQQQKQKNQLTWARSHLQQAQAPVKTLAEIQKEEAQKLEKQKKSEEKKQAAVKQNTVTSCGIWSNAASQLSWKGSSTNAWGQSAVNTGSSNQTSSSGPNFAGNMGEAFWDTSAPKESKSVSKNQESSALQHNIKSSGGNNNGSSGKSKSRKEEEVVMKIFSNQRRQKPDEFTIWCTGALSKYKSSIDIPTFIAFLKDVESPFDVSDYVNSYLGDTKETKEFANQFLEKRSYFRNQAKKEASEELMWGPAPAITPSVNKSSHNNNPSSNNGGDGNSGAASKKKKKKAKKVANSILGFTVQSDPDRINAGEIETVEK